MIAPTGMGDWGRLFTAPGSPRVGNNTANHNRRVHPLSIRTGPMRLHQRSSELTVYIYIWSMSHHSRTSTQPSLIITELSKLSSLISYRCG